MSNTIRRYILTNRDCKRGIEYVPRGGMVRWIAHVLGVDPGDVYQELTSMLEGNLLYCSHYIGTTQVLQPVDSKPTERETTT